MGLIIPYTFKGGTSAKAEEVNANFYQIQKFCNNLESTQNTIASTVEGLNADKANLNGSRSQVFEVANPTSDYQAVNKGYLDSRLEIFNTIINGLYIRQSGNQSYYITAGGCYDSNFINPMILRQNLNQVIDETLNANTTYNIFVLATTENSTITTVTLTIGNNNPSISDITIYRKIGTITLDENKYINTITREEV